MADVLSGNVRSLHEALRSKSPHRAERAAQLATDLYQLCVESVSDTEKAYCSSVLFDKTNGVLEFLRGSATVDEFATAQEELLRLLNDYTKILRSKALPYAQDIKEVCSSLFSRAKASKVKNATFPPLITVLELCAGTSQVGELNVPKLVDKYLQACFKPTKHTATVRAGIFHLLGLFCELYPEHSLTLSERLISIFMRTLKSEMLSKSKKPEMAVIGGCLRGLNSYLVNFSQSAAEGSEHAQNIYKFSKMAIDPKVSHSRYEVPRAGLSIIARHAAQFKEYLAKDHEHMYEVLYHWCEHTNRENRMVAFLALEAFLQQVSVHIVEGGDGKDRQTYAPVFRDFIKKFRAIIDNPVSGHRELTVAIKGYGYFAAPCKLFMKSEDINFMFGEMVQRSEHLFFTSLSGSEDRVHHLPALLEALASIVREMDTLSEAFLSSLEKLMVLLFEVLPRLPPDLQMPTYYAVMRLILGVAANRSALKSFLSHVVYQGLIRTCSHPVVIQVGDGSVVVAVGDGGGAGGREGERMDIGDKKQPSYMDYVQMWRHIMDPSKLKGIQMRDPALWSALHQLIYDEVIGSVLKIIRRLNLSATTSFASEEEPMSPSSASLPVVHVDPVTGLLPSVPRDFQIFINLVDLCRSLLPEVDAAMFEQWVLPFGREVIVASSSHPLVSGFYKLLGTCLTLCKNWLLSGHRRCEGSIIKHCHGDGRIDGKDDLLHALQEVHQRGGGEDEAVQGRPPGVMSPAATFSTQRTGQT
ncbi:DNA-dependent protein kinase catalytic subunit [Geodia barretti]|uniref:DNA-dependent protein kinase catalytic subunit n=1 Tax=Geodia barretti TaxID=519541 RepID=A0AA35TP73_GEOBA|nr:DNA-dependent protein kinase catalytic subunit [Geodia barretti]